LNLSATPTVETEDYSYEVDGFPLCDYQIKIHRTADGSTMIFGQMPQANGPLSAKESDWSSLDLVSERVRAAQEAEGHGSESPVVESKRCLLAQGGALKAVWQVDVMSRGLLYAFTADADAIYSSYPKHFDAAGEAQIIASNVPKAPMVKVDFNDLADTGYLVNSYFETCLAKSSTVTVCPTTPGTEQEAFAKAGSNSFIFDPLADSNEFVQTSIFANVNKALAWAQSQGYQNFGTSRIRVVAHATFSNPNDSSDPNNALYMPGNSQTPPQILIGDGDGNILQNLGTDEDVVSHEFGHHIVYHKVKNIQGEALVLHEGMADFFTFARTGNACLGETICPGSADGQFSCYKPNQCLRSAENTMKWRDPSLPKQPHLRGQLISGFMWDLYKKDNIPLETVTSLAFKSIDLLIATSGYQHLLLSLLLADKTSFNGQYCQTIIDRAKARGFEEFLSEATCNKVASSADVKSVQDLEIGAPGNTAASATPAASAKKKGCGVLTAGSTTGQTGGFLVLWIMPMIIAWFRRFRS
jgi:hypothetical protein